MSLDRARLARVLGMTGSSFDGEALAALRRAQHLLGAAGLSWEQLLINHDVEVATQACHRLLAENDALREQLAQLQVKATFTSPQWTEPYTAAEKIDRCIEFTQWCSDWEREFITNLAGWRGALTPKQTDRLDEVITKLRRIARARGLAA